METQLSKLIMAILENAGKMSMKEITEASSAVAALINARISRRCRKKFVISINRNLSP